MKKMIVSLVVMSLVVPNMAFSETIQEKTTVLDDKSCIGYIEDWDLTRSGYLYMDGTWNNSKRSQRLCSINGDFDNIDGEICKIWISTLMGAFFSGKKVKLKYKNIESCEGTDLGEWSKTVKAPEYIRVYAK